MRLVVLGEDFTPATGFRRPLAAAVAHAMLSTEELIRFDVRMAVAESFCWQDIPPEFYDAGISAPVHLAPLECPL